MSIHISDHTSFPVVTLENTHGSARIALFGGHVLSYIPSTDHQERLWVSEKAKLDGSKAIRGGIPVCWPWFSDAHGQAQGSLPSHGFVRTQMWQIREQHSEVSQERIVLKPTSTEGPGFSAPADLTLTVILSETLTVVLSTTNRGTTAFPLGCALHTYFNVSDIMQTRITGLSGEYKDKTRDWAVLPTPSPYVFTEETDRVHLQAAPEVNIERPTLSPIRVLSEGHDSVVVWNPWAENARAMGDMQGDGYQTMLCVETALTLGFDLQPGATHALTQIIR